METEDILLRKVRRNKQQMLSILVVYRMPVQGDVQKQRVFRLSWSLYYRTRNDGNARKKREKYKEADE